MCQLQEILSVWELCSMMNVVNEMNECMSIDNKLIVKLIQDCQCLMSI